MIIDRLELLNFGTFKGSHALALGPGTYALLGEIDDDPAKSNGSGKSTLLSSIRFALYGARSSQELVSWGEAKMHVHLHLSTGATIKRGWDQRGWVEVTGVEDARRKDADLAVAELTGFDAEDFAATCYLLGGDAGRLAKAGPAERRDLLAAWVVPPIWAALADRALAKLRQAELALAAARSRQAAQVPVDVAQLQAERQRLYLELQALQPAPPELQRQALQAQLARSTHLDRLAAFGRLVEQPLPEPPSDKLQDLTLASGVARMDAAMARQRLAELEQLAVGEFAGPCPVDGVLCPRATEIRKGGLLHRGKLSRARTQQNALDATLRAAEDREAAHRTAWAARGRAIEAIRGAEAALPAPTPYKAVHRGALRAAPASARDQLAHQVGQLDARLQRAAKDAGAAQELARAVQGLEVAVASWRWMVRACGRDGVPAMLVDEAAHVIAEEASRALAAAGSPLALRFRTAEPLKKLASHCGCGVEFAARAKACACGLARGPQLAPDLSVLVRRGAQAECPLDLRSSGEGDVAALGLRLGAAAYRRRQTGAALATLVLDEVDARCDAANIEMIMDLVMRGAGKLGSEQIFFSSHRPAMAHRGQRTIRVRQKGGWSTLDLE